MTDINLIEIFCILDEFCKYFAPELKKTQVGHMWQMPPQPSVPHVGQRGDDHPRTLPHHAPP